MNAEHYHRRACWKPGDGQIGRVCVGWGGARGPSSSMPMRFWIVGGRTNQGRGVTQQGVRSWGIGAPRPPGCLRAAPDGAAAAGRRPGGRQQRSHLCRRKPVLRVNLAQSRSATSAPCFTLRLQQKAATAQLLASAAHPYWSSGPQPRSQAATMPASMPAALDSSRSQSAGGEQVHHVDGGHLLTGGWGVETCALVVHLALS